MNTPSVADVLQSGVPLTLVRQDECVFTNRAMVLATTLGSCVAAAFRHRQSGTCALFHAFWPTAPDKTAIPAPCRYADQAVEGVAERYRSLGIPLHAVEADVAGGAYSGNPSMPQLDIGKRNVESVLAALKQLGFAVCSLDVRGSASRTLFLDTATGRTWIRRMEPDWEKRYDYLEAQPLSGGASCKLIVMD
jgi:chemotaxis protein CheD